MGFMSLVDFTKKLVVALLLLALYSKLGPSLPFSVVSQDKGQPLVVEGTGKIVTKPDTAIVTAGIDEEGESLKAVQEASSQKSQSLVSAIKELGIDEDDIKTTSYNVFPQYSYERGAPQIIGYRVSIVYEIKVRNIELVNRVLTGVTASGANLVGGVNFEVSDEAKEKLLDEARQEAAQKAREKAESLAKATGVRLGKVLSVTESEVGGSPPVSLLERDLAVGSEPTPPEVLPGESEISIVVTISFEIR